MNAIEILEMREEIDRLRAELSKRDWISVDERLPQMGEVVLGWGWHELPMHIYRSAEPSRNKPYTWWDYNEDAYDVVGVTHWMPLPEPPK